MIPSCHSCGRVLNRVSLSEGEKEVNTLAAGFFDVEFTCREIVTKQVDEEIQH
jgi:hypothetical protein